MIDNYEQSALAMQGQMNELIGHVFGDWQELEIHQVEEVMFRKLLEIGKVSLMVYVQEKGTGDKLYGEDG